MASYPNPDDPLSDEWADRILARHNEVTERELCPKCGRPWQEPGGVSLDYNADRARFVTDVVSYEGYQSEKVDDPEQSEPWEEWLAGEIDWPYHFIVCARCIDAEGAMRDYSRGALWYKDGGEAVPE